MRWENGYRDHSGAAKRKWGGFEEGLFWLGRAGGKGVGSSYVGKKFITLILILLSQVLKLVLMVIRMVDHFPI